MHRSQSCHFQHLAGPSLPHQRSWHGVLRRCVVLVLGLRLARMGEVEPLTWRLARAWLPVNLLCARPLQHRVSI